MPLETASTIAELNENNPVGASDTPASLDNHIQLIKAVLKADALVEADIGVNVAAYSHNHTGVYQPADTELTALAGLTSAANKVPMFSGSGTATLIDFKDEDDMVSNSATAVPSQQSVKAYVDASQSGLGIGQIWTNVLASRTSGSTYTNTTGNPIAVSVGATSPGASVVGISLTATVGGVTVAACATNTTYSSPCISFIVPNGASYVVTISGVAFAYWSELRA